MEKAYGRSSYVFQERAAFPETKSQTLCGWPRRHSQLARRDPTWIHGRPGLSWTESTFFEFQPHGKPWQNLINARYPGERSSGLQRIRSCSMFLCGDGSLDAARCC